MATEPDVALDKCLILSGFGFLVGSKDLLVVPAQRATVGPQGRGMRMAQGECGTCQALVSFVTVLNLAG